MNRICKRIIANNDILDKTKKIYFELDEYAGTHYNDENIQQMIKDLCAKVNAKVSFHDIRPHYMRIEWNIGSYTGGQSVMMSMLRSDIFRLVEDLTMAFYRTNGGEGFNTNTLIDELNK